MFLLSIGRFIYRNLYESRVISTSLYSLITKRSESYQRDQDGIVVQTTKRRGLLGDNHATTCGKMCPEYFFSFDLSKMGLYIFGSFQPTVSNPVVCCMNREPVHSFPVGFQHSARQTSRRTRDMIV